MRKYPNACKDQLGRLRVGAAVGVAKDREMRIDALFKAGVMLLQSIQLTDIQKM